jgi:hypothetical protein
MRIDEETHLWSVPSGSARPGDATVRVFSAGSFCSGVLVDRSLVLTARHCLVEEGHWSELEGPGAVLVELGGDYLPWGRAGVVGVMACPSGDAWQDVAVLVLEHPLPVDVPAYPPRLAAPPRLGEPVRVVGFGPDHDIRILPGKGGAPVVHLFTTRRSGREGRTTCILDDAFCTDVHAYGGDSGGAVVSLEDERLLGLVSQRSEGRAPSGLDVTDQTIAARVDTCAPVLDDALAMVRQR